MAGEVVVREAEFLERVAVEEVCRVSFGRVYGFFAVRSLGSPGSLLVGEMHRVVAGFAKLATFSVGGRALGGVLWLAVRPEFRRRGVASALMEAAVEYLMNQGVTAVYVSTRKDNLPALKLFQGRGFRKVGFRVLLELFGFRVVELYLKLRTAPSEIVLFRGQKTRLADRLA
jgi:ribosomal protein S18 acetylase RimI-like enzyme